MAKKKVDFDPVKQVDDVKNQAVVWSTASLNAAVEAKKKGLPLKANPFLNNDIQLLKPNLVFRRTEAEQEDWWRCKEDKVYFANKCYLKTPAGITKVQMRDYQMDYLKMCQDNYWSIWLAARQVGKSVTNGIDMLHELLFDIDKAALIVSKSGPAGIELLGKIKDMYRYLPWHLKAGINVWNVHQVSFDNNSKVWTVPPAIDAGVGDTVNFLLLDEFAWLPLSGEDVELYLSNILPTISQDESAKVRIMSTQNGHNTFYKIWSAAIKGENEYATFKVDWHQVPQLNKKTGQWEKRTEAWKDKMIKRMGSKEAFYYMYGTQFMSSDNCLVSRECLTSLHETEHVFRELNAEEKDSIVMTEEQKNCFRLHKDYFLRDLRNRNCVVLVDLAEGGGGDSTVFHIFEVKLDNGEAAFDEIAYWKSNKMSLEETALVFWLMTQTVLSPEWFLASVELNTYGILFENYVMQLNEPDFRPEWNWRFTNASEFDYTCLAAYKKNAQDEDLPGMKKTNAKTLPGIRWNSSNKPAACMMLKAMLEKKAVRLYDIAAISELESFEDKTGKGHYKASYGHDDIIMTCVQIPKMMETVKWKGFLEELPTRVGNARNDYDEGPSIYEELGGMPADSLASRFRSFS